MNINVSLYDFFCMVFIGFLLIILMLPNVPTDFNLFYCACCYAVGMVFHKTIEFFTPYLRNCLYLLNEGYLKADWGMDKDQNKYKTKAGTIKKNIKHDYYEEYYYLQNNKSLGIVPKLEAQSAFLRNLWFVSICYIISNYLPQYCVSINMPIIMCLILFGVYLVMIVLTYLLFNKLRSYHLLITLIGIFIISVIIFFISSVFFYIQNSSQTIVMFRDVCECCKDNHNYSLNEFLIFKKRHYLAIILFLLIPWLWYSTETKISYLVWEKSFFLKQSKKENK